MDLLLNWELDRAGLLGPKKTLPLLEGQRDSGVLVQPLKKDLMRRLFKALFL